MNVSFPLPPIAVWMMVSSAMPILFVSKFALLNVPGLRLMVAGADHPDRSSVLLVPPSQIVITGFVFTVKSK